MKRTILIYVGSFLAGAVVTIIPFLIKAYFVHVDELSRGEQTMASGMTAFIGFLAAPVGGTIATLIAAWLRRKKSNSKSGTLM